jgi:hypothetical protein
MEHLLRLIHIIKRNVIFCISVTGTLILHLVIAWQPLNRLEGFSFRYSNGPLMDDSYILFKISKDIADWLSGCSPSLQLTSGFQPLIAFLYTPIFQLFLNHKELPIHFALSLNAIFGFCANILIYCLLRKVASRSIATFLVSIWIWSPYVMNQSVNGMETTLALLLLLVTLNHYWQINHLPHTRPHYWFLLGVFVGVGFWARVDLGMLGIAIVLDQAWRAINDNQTSRSLRLQNILLCSLTAMVVASPWIFFTLVTTNNVIPLSGKAVHQITSVLFNRFHPDHSGFPFMMFKYCTEEFLMYQPLIALSKHITWQLFITCLTLLGLILALLDRQLRVLLRPIWFLQVLILMSYLIFIGGFWHLYRYLYPVYTLMLFLHAVTLRYLTSKLKLKPWVLCLILFLLFIPYALSYTFQYYSTWTNNLPSRYLSASLFARDIIPKEARVGTFQSGCLSYWLDNQVINLDGVVNKEAYIHLKFKMMDLYMDQQQIDYFVEEVYLVRIWDDYLGGQLSQNYTRVALRSENSLHQAWNEFGIYKRKDEGT